jgi:hypothetical protein
MQIAEHIRHTPSRHIPAARHPMHELRRSLHAGRIYFWFFLR